MEVNEGKDGKINTKGAEKKGRQFWKRKGLKKKKRRKGGKIKEERTGRINLVPEGKWKIYEMEIGVRKVEYQDQNCKL